MGPDFPHHDAKTERRWRSHSADPTLVELAPHGAQDQWQKHADDDFTQRYETGELLGEGGMGLVRRLRDRRVGRSVALKTLRKEHASPLMLARFVREARIQGQLEHPGIVPVYDLTKDSEGNLAISMRRLQGRTLADVLDLLTARNPEALQRYTRRRLLITLSSVCQTLEYAHSRGVIHRDLKPSNIMLGDFGEVYVLDWGIARLLGEAEPLHEDGIDAGPSIHRPTLDGDILGTPGYMSPEQATGDLAVMDPRSDVYALGAILFEILTLQPLHLGSETQGLLRSTLQQVDARPSARCPDQTFPPELEQLCQQATALDPRVRLPTVRAMHEALEHLLEGAKDLERRHNLANRHALEAGIAAKQATGLGPGAQQARTHALQELSQALALVPGHTHALNTLVQLLVEPPAEVPASVEEELARGTRKDRKRGLFFVMTAQIVWLLSSTLCLGMGIRSWPPALGAVALILVGLLSTTLLRKAPEVTDRHVLGLLGLNSCITFLFSTLFGSLLFLPSVVVANHFFFALMVGTRRFHRLLIALGSVLLLLPLGLEALGLWPTTYTMEPGVFSIHAHLTFFSPLWTKLFLLSSALIFVSLPVVMANRAREAVDSAARKMAMTTWQLKQMVPEAAQPYVSVSTNPSL